jgi:hypothetical protein
MPDVRDVCVSAGTLMLVLGALWSIGCYAEDIPTETHIGGCSMGFGVALIGAGLILVGIWA